MNENHFICAICDKQFKNRCSLTKHIIRDHKLTNKTYFDNYIEPNDDHICPICKINERKWHRNYYLQTCSCKECELKLIGIKNHINQLKPETRKKYEETCIAKYGVDNSFKADEVKNKIRTTCIERYGNEYRRKFFEYGKAAEKSWTTEARCKRIKTNLIRYGAENYRSSNEWKEKAKTIANNRTIDEKDAISKKRKETCESKYGVSFATQSPIVKEKIFNKRIHNEIKENRPTFDGLIFDSKLELDVYKYCKENNIEVKYHPCSLKYRDSFDKEHLYFPDFEINGELYEVKGEHLFKDGHLYCPFRKGLSKEELEILDDIYLSKTNCINENFVKIIFKLDDLILHLHK